MTFLKGWDAALSSQGSCPRSLTPARLTVARGALSRQGGHPSSGGATFSSGTSGSTEPLYACLLLCTVRMRGALPGSLLLGVQSRALPPLFQWVLFSKAS